MEKETKNKMKMWDCVLCVVIGVIVALVGFSNFMDASSTANKYQGTKWVAQETKQKANSDKTGSIVVIGVGAVFILVGIFDYSKRKQKYIANMVNSNNSENNTSAKLEELKKMLDQEIITQEEFENKKKELLEKM